MVGNEVCLGLEEWFYGKTCCMRNVGMMISHEWILASRSCCSSENPLMNGNGLKSLHL